MENKSADKISKVTTALNTFLQTKNKLYGDSALNPAEIFTRHVSGENLPGVNAILVRLDDKLKRVENSEKLRKNDVVDIMGYLTLLCCAKGWYEFSDLID